MGVGYENVLGQGGAGVLWTADGTAYSNSTNLTDVSPTPNLVIPANALFPGAAFRIWTVGKYSTTGTPTLQLGFYWGAVAASTTVGSTIAMPCSSTASNWPFRIEALAICRSAGSSGTLAVAGEAILAQSATSFQTTSYTIDQAAFSPFTIDTTAAKAFTLGASWGTKTNPNTLTINEWCVEALNF